MGREHLMGPPDPPRAWMSGGGSPARGRTVIQSAGPITLTVTGGPYMAPVPQPGFPDPPVIEARGGLPKAVLLYLKARGGQDCTPGEIQRWLGQSSQGAINYALKTLSAMAGAQVARTSESPIRYRYTGPPTHTGPPTMAPASVITGGPADPGEASALRKAVTERDVLQRREAERRERIERGELLTSALRPSGEVYRTRQLADLPDVVALRQLRTTGLYALLWGPPGAGKTALAEAAFGEDLITIAGDGDTTVDDFVGGYVPAEDRSYLWVHGPLVEAMQAGAVLFIDDATLISPKVLSVLYPAMDGRRRIIVKTHTGETVHAAEGFYVIAGHNPGAPGAILSEALQSRFLLQVQVSTDYELALSAGVDKRAVKVARNLTTKVAHGDCGWAPQLRELLAFARVSTVLGERAALANLVGLCPAEDRDVVSAVVKTVYAIAEISPLTLGGQV